MPAALPIAIGGMAVSQLGSSIIQSKAAGDAADTQAAAANHAADLQYQAYQQQQQNQMPWVQAGQSALYGQGGLLSLAPGAGSPVSAMSEGDWVKNRMSQLAPNGTIYHGLAGDMDLSEGYKSQAENDWKSYGQQQQQQAMQTNAGKYQLNPDLTRSFTQKDFLNNQDPAYQFDLQQGQQALERSAAAKGGLMGGGVMKDLTSYAQGMASNEYQNAYNRFTNNQSQSFNRLASLAGLGQTANGQASAAGMNMANNVGNIMTGSANAQGAASIAQGNAWGGALSGLGNTAMGYGIMKSMMPGGAFGAGASTGSTAESAGLQMPTFGSSLNSSPTYSLMG